MVTPPGWGSEQTEAAPEPDVATQEEVFAATAPGMCGVPSGELADGVLPTAPPAQALGDEPLEPAATDVRIAVAQDTGEPIMAIPETGGGEIGAAAVFSCEIEGAVAVDHVVVWDASLEPIGAINLSALRGAAPVVGDAVEVAGATVEVGFRDVGDGTVAEPGGAAFSVPLTVEGGQLIVGALTDEGEPAA